MVKKGRPRKGAETGKKKNWKKDIQTVEMVIAQMRFLS